MGILFKMNSILTIVVLSLKIPMRSADVVRKSIFRYHSVP
jgi:hypothetical protein